MRSFAQCRVMCRAYVHVCRDGFILANILCSLLITGDKKITEMHCVVFHTDWSSRAETTLTRLSCATVQMVHIVGSSVIVS